MGVAQKYVISSFNLKNIECKRFVGPKNIGIEPKLPIICHICDFSIFDKKFPRSKRGVVKNGLVLAFQIAALNDFGLTRVLKQHPIAKICPQKKCTLNPGLLL